MRKTLILLVDDDPAVIDALVATLVSAFEAVAHAEAYKRAEDVLAAVPRWVEEQRSIAVGIGDQRMPTMTGVELLTLHRGETLTMAKGAPDAPGRLPMEPRTRGRRRSGPKKRV